MIMTTQELLNSLKQAGMRITPQRIAICDLLSNTRMHPTAAAIYDQIKAQYPSLSLATVYNTLEALTGLGAIHQVGSAGDDSAHYDADISPHMHLACIECNRIIDVFTDLAAAVDDEISRKFGYKILGARIVYYGLCPECQKSIAN